MHIFRPQCYETLNQLQEKNLKRHQTLGLKNILLKNEWANQEVKEEIKKYMETNENDNTTAQKPLGRSKGGLKREYTAIKAFPKKKGLKYAI